MSQLLIELAILTAGSKKPEPEKEIPVCVCVLAHLTGPADFTIHRYLVHILSPVSDNCSSWISGRGRMAVEIFSWPGLHERMCRTWVSNSGPLDSDRATAPGISTKRKRTNIATENQFLHFELHAFYGDVLTLLNAEIRGKVLFDSTTEYRFLRS